ncbi:metal-binding protein [Gordonia iterans]|uniref:Metal-binding protein n=2 Tax=Gordonia iterans TaxID=1004901 RepID=A0A2S0KF91_9ACTN|nr:YceD family protein [Gordonia iterans]AVM00362.1 metal-binding protein [Gordonia iterans]
MIEVHRTVSAPERIGAEMIGIPEGGEVDFDLRLESVSEGVLVTGTVRAGTQGQCGRCLEAVNGDVDLFLTELFAYPESETEQTTDEEDVARLVDDEVDLEQLIIDAVGTELPLSPVCDESCPGLCVECGIRLADAEPGHGHETIDPRWAGLARFADGGEAGQSNEERES